MKLLARRTRLIRLAAILAATLLMIGWTRPSFAAQPAPSDSSTQVFCPPTVRVWATSTRTSSVPQDAYDCNTATRWNASTNIDSLYAQFPEKFTFSGLQLYADALPTTTETYTIYGGNDGVSWKQLAQSTQTVVSIDEGGQPYELAPITFATVRYQYLRIDVNADLSWAALNEVELIVSPPSPPPASLHLSWHTRAPMPTRRDMLGLVTAANGKIYAIGGANTYYVNPVNVVEEYDPLTNRWSTRSPMPTARYNVGIVATPDGKIYVAGGGITPDGGSCTSAVEVYDTATDRWQTVASLPVPMASEALALGPDGEIYSIGGWLCDSGTTASVYAYNPSSNTWSPRASLPNPVCDLGATTGKDGRIYAIGGVNPSSASPVNSAYAYDTTTNSWTTLASMPTARGHLGVTLGLRGRIYAIGGMNGSSVAQSAVEVYNPTRNHWLTQTNLLVPQGNVSATTGPNGGIYVIGGSNGSGLLNVNEVGSYSSR